MSSGSQMLGQQPENSAEAFTSVAKYDFCRSDRISKDQIRSIHLLHSYFARNFSSSLSAYLRSMAEVNLSSIDQISYMDFLKRLSDPTLYCALTLRPMHGSVALEISPSIGFPMIDILLGGPGHPAAENRALTEIEMNIMEGVVRLILRDMKEAWRPILEIDPRLEGSETKPQMLQIVAPGEAVVAIGFEIKLGENTGVLHLCLPSMMLKMSRAKFDQHWRPRRSDSDGKEGQKVRELVRSVQVTLSTEIHNRNLLIEDLLSIGAGDIMQLDQRLSDPVLLCIGGVPKFRGRIVVRRGKKAFEILEPCDF
jgi:flagellar motor switch protein FliM